jgi:phage baseplate assembly protein gpV
LNGDGTIASAGNWTHSGTFSANGIGLTTHHHGGVAAGSGTSGGPIA